MPALLRKYGVSGVIQFPTLAVSGSTFTTGITWAASDLRRSKDGAAFANATNAPSSIGQGLWSWAYTASEATCQRLSVMAKDQTAARVFEPVVILIETYGNTSAQHPVIGATGKTGYALTSGQHDSIGTRVWATTARTLTSGLVMWSVAARTLTAWSFTVSVGAIAAGAKTGYSLVTGQHDAIGTRTWAVTARTLTSGAVAADSVWARTRAQATGVPTATAAAGSQLMFLYMSARNKRLTTATGDKIHNGASAVIAKAALSASSTVFTKTVYVTATG